MDRSKTVELMPILWRLGTGRKYPDYPRERDLAAVEEMGECVVGQLAGWLEDECKIIRTGAAVALQRVAPMLVLEVAWYEEEETAGDDRADGAVLAFSVSRPAPGVVHRSRRPMPMMMGASAMSTHDSSQTPI